MVEGGCVMFQLSSQRQSKSVDWLSQGSTRSKSEHLCSPTGEEQGETFPPERGGQSMKLLDKNLQVRV